jgi:D-alanine-D-alanine ligase-like ATP-grasp enzyme
MIEIKTEYKDAILELLGMPYTGCDVLTGATGINRIITKELLRTKGIPLAISGMAANNMPAMAKDTSMPSEEVFPKLFEYVKW